MYLQLTNQPSPLANGLDNAGQIMQQQAAGGQSLQQAQLDNIQKQNMYAAMVLGTAGQSGNPQLYASAKQHLNGLGYDTSIYSDDPMVGAQQAQLTRMYGASPTMALRAMVMEQEMAQRAGNATGDPTAFGWQPGIGNGMGMMGFGGGVQQPQGQPRPAPQQQPQPQPQAGSAVNMGNGQTTTMPPSLPASEQVPVGQVLGNGNGSQSNLPPMPVKGKNETIPSYNARLSQWKALAENSPTQQQTLSESKEAGKQTIEGSDALVKQVASGSTMLNTLAEMGDTLQKFQAGAFAPAKAQLLRMARAAGVDVSDDDISQLQNAQVFQKLAMNTLSTAAKNEGQAARLQGAFNALKQSNPNWTLEPETLISLRNFMSVPIQRDMTELQQWNTTKNGNPNADFPSFERNFIANSTQQQTQAGGSLPAFNFKDKSAPMGSNMPNSAQIGGYVQTLQKKGYSMDQINQWLQAKGYMNAAGQ